MKDVWEVMWCANGGETEFEEALPEERMITFQQPSQGAIVAVRPDLVTDLSIICQPSEDGAVRVEIVGDVVICLRLAGLSVAVGVANALGLKTIEFVMLDASWSMTIDLTHDTHLQVAEIERRIAEATHSKLQGRKK
ncbi:hypothetical protein GH865_12970 [Rhodocyclus tenuis]|uniref:Uncharacterized protein n=1 Tax=Rhodocyclus tenuis TaxID=1066 RepID=A0A6L5JVP3_RHOTE|nr:hypothetical protein [Rhodocyclus gracilis]MQY51309.1 hypothetical protein [Rhodocyclus gracilis]MRD74150.1 hypothetical protein [Rhodocyclus gracilis]